MLRSLLRRGEFWIVLAAVAARIVPGPRTIDDAYITFRYAQNLLQGHGLVYNPGERVLGTTTPAYAALLAAAGWLTGGPQADFPLLSLLINAAADALTCYLLPRLGELLGQRGAGRAAAVVWAIAPWSVTFAIGGMETSLVVALTTGTFYLHLSGRPVGAALCGSLALLTRPDSLIFLLPLAAARVTEGVRARKARATGADDAAAARDAGAVHAGSGLWPFKSGQAPVGPQPGQGGLRVVVAPLAPGEALATAAPLAGWAAIGFAFYGSPVPNSVVAKAAAYRIGPTEGLARLVQHFATPFVGHELLGPMWIRIGALAFPLLFFLGAAAALRANRRSWPLFLYPALYLVVFAAANPLLFRWYLTPPLPAYLLGIFLGAARIGSDLKSRIPLLLLAGLALFTTASAWTLRPDHGPSRPAPRMAYIQLELLYREAADHLRTRIEPGQSIASADIGALGYFSQAPVLDLLGLISPQVQPYYPVPDSVYVINFAIAPEAVLQFRPDYVVLLEVYGRRGLLLDRRFLDEYAPVETIPTDIYSSRGLLIYHRASP